MSDTPHIAVVDDEAQIREAVGEYLELHGFEVSLADGGEALRAIMAAGKPLDLVILDLNMPGEDGLTIARYLREHSNVGIVILTAAGQTLDRIIGLEIGADDYMGKPFDLRELLARIKSVLRRVATDSPAPGNEAGEDEVKIGRLILNTASHKLFDEDGEEIQLTSMEYDLLQVFAGNANRVLNRDELLDLSHSQNSDPFDRSIDVRIARLRRKIEKDPSKPQILKTIRGAGYMFVPAAEG
ncbi:MAG: response regulator [Alphaproteobacteria bacterium]|nr:response regulator [Alphaproteobacteria bacterium]